ncbi:MAG: EAL domain-containing protein [Levilactobacillus sp.]|jgi:EAL domain-containing protein (putative c-di-GMP-specific phosphodiesterase class I)|uniref:EAL domain-containing protein n=1 Tax=Levilactobacillus suantsaiihabitans TaxID=2487722 RepID=A0A4Z0J9U5_9LACO|nr:MULTISPECIES: EAL domain-containing protein [Levilactobacillus]MCI1553580.1 EAL domain-containing protein [Levilactobacillus sp.]MCI1597969.1 EAL domain-containing protein [Levilactobacillus sp.]MCI1606363.1 EAL domain-containing protein [Levilactobacillus sp.]TGD17810.1 EAL domain-containing protein [Levilactobacillus suantsaiihabitans]
MYRFFVQPQVNVATQKLAGYELLLRSYHHNYWVTPTDFTALPMDQQVSLSYQEITNILKDHTDNPEISLNLNREQFSDRQTIGHLIHLKKSIKNLNLIVELTEAPSLEELHRYVALYRSFGIKLSLDDVGTDNPWGPHVQDVLPFMDSIKFAMQNFRLQHRQKELLPSLKAWRKIADMYQLGFTLEGIEDPSDVALAKQYNAEMTQGYYYSKPVPYAAG